MSNKIITFVKEHPISVGAGVIGLIVLYMLYSSSGSGSVVYAPGTTSDPNADALTAQTLQLQYGYAAQQDTNAANVAIATLQTSASRDVSLAGIQAQENVQLSGNSSQVQIAQLAANTNQAQIQASEDLGLAQAGTYAHIADVNSATQLGIVQAYTGAQIAQDEYAVVQTAVQGAATSKGANVGLTLPGGISIDYNSGNPRNFAAQQPNHDAQNILSAIPLIGSFF